jgi:ribosomal protein S18 acetylase RimI-like enzyme
MEQIDLLACPASDADVRDLTELLVEAVNSGASVSFMAPLPADDAEAWWRRTIAKIDDGAMVLVARDDAGIAGSVQVHPSWAPNQPHRADIAKLIVRKRARGRKLGTRLMLAAEDAARARGFTLLVLDTVPGSVAERLYRGMGWNEVGTIPGYALDPYGAMCDTVVFYKELAKS